MKNPCNNCRTRWLCTPYEGMCRRKKRYIKMVSRKISVEKANEFQNYVDGILESLRMKVEKDG